MQTYSDSPMYTSSHKPKNTKKKYELFTLLNSYWCTFKESPKHFDICPSSTKVLRKLCIENNMFIDEFVDLENKFLLQEKMFLCGKLSKSNALERMDNIHSKMSSLFQTDKYLNHHQSHFDVVTGKRNDMPSNKMDKDQLCSTI